MNLYLFKSNLGDSGDLKFKQQSGTREIFHPFIRESEKNSSKELTASIHQYYTEVELVTSIIIKLKNNFAWKLIDITNSDWQRLYRRKVDSLGALNKEDKISSTPVRAEPYFSLPFSQFLPTSLANRSPLSKFTPQGTEKHRLKARVDDVSPLIEEPNPKCNESSRYFAYLFGFSLRPFVVAASAAEFTVLAPAD